MSGNNTLVRFEDVTFFYAENKPLILEGNFALRRGAKCTLMGQNGAGKSTLFKLLTGELKPEEGRVIIHQGTTVALSRQVVPRDQLAWTVREFFQGVFADTVYDIDRRIDEVLPIVDFALDDYDKKMNTFSGGQQARLLLASALIQKPDLLLLDEPTNNLDHAGIEHLTQFLKDYNKTVIVISHDADFLNSFTESVLYLDVYSRTIEQYVGNYYKVLDQVAARVEKEKSQNARLEKSIQEKKDKANFFANKGGRLRAVAKRMREVAAEAEENKVDVRKEDKTIRAFTIPVQEPLAGEIITITSFTRLVQGKEQTKKVEITLQQRAATPPQGA
ncbi:MAG: ATP-binding cassette domain-containing protein, partial [Candidatus Pacebacteria bacterium]|nr:ATP-binding cassette domain-containing protein [Candidatus Paceibacterota bacterium]